MPVIFYFLIKNIFLLKINNILKNNESSVQYFISLDVNNIVLLERLL